MVRVLGVIEEPETEQEESELQARAAAYWERYHREDAEPFRNEIIRRVAPAGLDNARFLRMEAVVVARPGIAAELYPDLFTPGLGPVDKDGLVDYRHLLRHMQRQPGVFRDPDRDLLLFAHRFFRRGLSHRNKLNTYFLQSFEATAEECADLYVRLKLDPDILGHPASASNLIELEYWRGPLYSDDISAIPSGVTEHKADDRTRLYEGVDRTQIWWKAPEHRHVNGLSAGYRTFEVEELIENPAGGLGGDEFGCRYAHAEFSANEAAITHFDGAIRCYTGESYLKRIETSIDRAGKHAEYTKLFRLDGMLTIPHWKRLLSDHFRGNTLIPEYFGAPAETDGPLESVPERREPALAVLVSLGSGSVDDPMQLFAELCQECGGRNIPYVEIGVGAVGTYLRSRIDLCDITTIGFKDGILNLSRVGFGPSHTSRATFDVEVAALASALSQDVADRLVCRAAVPLIWELEGLLVTLTVAGEASNVARALQQLLAVIDPKKAPSEWIQALSDLVRAIAPSERSQIVWGGVDRGVLALSRSGEVSVQMRVPDALKGVLTTVRHTEKSECSGPL
jgi:hypothetical protein